MHLMQISLGPSIDKLDSWLKEIDIVMALLSFVEYERSGANWGFSKVLLYCRVLDGIVEQSGHTE